MYYLELNTCTTPYNLLQKWFSWLLERYGHSGDKIVPLMVMLTLCVYYRSVATAAATAIAAAATAAAAAAKWSEKIMPFKT